MGKTEEDFQIKSQGSNWAGFNLVMACVSTEEELVRAFQVLGIMILLFQI